MTNIKQSLAYSVNNMFDESIKSDKDLDLYSTNKYSVSKFSQILDKLNIDNIECDSIYKIIINFCKKENCILLEYYVSNESRPNFSVKSILESVEKKLFQLSVTKFKDLHISAPD